jgi:hypothetical protein
MEGDGKGRGKKQQGISLYLCLGGQWDLGLVMLGLAMLSASLDKPTA